MLKKSFSQVFFFLLGTLSAQISVYDIQYTESGGQYPSPYANQTVTVGGIVSATEYTNGGFFISSSEGGAWNGLYVDSNLKFPSLGDSISFRGQVSEYLGVTRINIVDSYQRPDANQQQPEPALIPAAVVSSTVTSIREPYEGVLVSLSNVAVVGNFEGGWQVEDTSGTCTIGTGFINLRDHAFPLIIGYPFARISGIIDGNWYGYKLHPRSIDDLQSAPDAFVFILPGISVDEQSAIEVPVSLALLNQTGQISAYELSLQYDSAYVEYLGFAQEGTLSESGTIDDDQSVSGQVVCSFSGDASVSGIQTLLKLNFIPLQNGESDLVITSASVNGNDTTYTKSGRISTEFGVNDIGDTLTVIQRPLQNIPAIVPVGQELEITCLAPENTTDWQAELLYPLNQVPLSISVAQYDSSLQRWHLSATMPDPGLYELYDLSVTASGGVSDVTTNSVQVIRRFKDSYYFVHITDTHLPSGYYYYEPEFPNDSSSTNDLRAIIDDINLINPEFVLHTGDLVHEGELEDWQEHRYYTKAQRLLSELEVPFYLTSGNHDIGGWNDTPPSQGTARRDWWRFFGWPWLADPPADDPFRTQNYAFDYGPVHFVGLEAYDNYDNYLYNIYGNTSFTAGQITWLHNDLFYSDAETKVLFYHYDFSNQIYLASLSADMALWGHIHQNSGDINQAPYNLSTGGAVRDRYYRVIRVENGVLHPENTIYAGQSGNMLTISFSPSNSGAADTVTAQILNGQHLRFEQGRIKFVMPPTEFNFFVEHGSLDQVFRLSESTLCYVNVDIPASGSIDVRIWADSTISVHPAGVPRQFALLPNYPNPFNPTTRLTYHIAQAGHCRLTVYDLSGREMVRLVDGRHEQGSFTLTWNGTDAAGRELPSGIYTAHLQTPYFAKSIKMLMLK